MADIYELDDLNLYELERKYNTKGMKQVFLKVKQFIDDARASGYQLPEWNVDIKLD